MTATPHGSSLRSVAVKNPPTCLPILFPDYPLTVYPVRAPYTFFMVTSAPTKARKLLTILYHTAPHPPGNSYSCGLLTFSPRLRPAVPLKHPSSPPPYPHSPHPDFQQHVPESFYRMAPFRPQFDVSLVTLFIVIHCALFSLDDCKVL